jgi:hypothetical protein
MKIKIITLFVTVFLAALPALSQTTVVNQNLLPTISQARTVPTFDNRAKVMIGSPTLLAKYVPGKIALVGTREIVNDQMNFDAYKGELLFMKDGKEMVVPIKMVKRFVLKDPEQNDSLKFTVLTVEDEPAFYQVLVEEEKVALYKKYYKILDKPSPTDGYNTNDTRYELIDRKKFLLWNGKEIVEFRTKKQLFEYFPDEKAELEKFIKQEDIDFKGDDSLIRLFVKISQLKNP